MSTRTLITSLATGVTVLLALAGAAHADTSVVPNAFAATVGGAQTNRPTSNLTYTYQLEIAASQLAGLSVGDQISGLHWRALSGTTQGAAWPPAGGASWTNFDIYLSSAITTPATMSNTFALNEGADRILVRGGAYSIPAGSYTNNQVSGTVSPWGPLVSFTTPFTYNGGAITLTLRQQGNAQATSYFLDSVAPTNTAAGYGTLFATRATVSGAAADYTAASGTPTAFVITQFEFTHVPAPSAAALLGLGGLVAARRRR